MASVVVIGPNLVDQSTGSFHVHAAGCSDIKRREYSSREFEYDRTHPIEFGSEVEVSEYINSDFIDDDNPAESFLNDIHFFPCVNFEEKKESIVDTKTVTILRKITFEVVVKGMFFNVEIFATPENFADALSEIFAMRNSRAITY